MRARVLAASVTLAVLALSSRPSEAQPAPRQPDASPAQDRARGLANEGMDLFERGDAAAALERFREADRTFHAPTLTLMVARCQVKLGALADAAATYEALSAETLPPGAPGEFADAVASARVELAAIAPRVPRVQVTREPGDGAVGWVLRVDGREIVVPPTGLQTRVNPGTHDVALVVGGSVVVARRVVLGEGALEQVSPPPAPPPPKRERGVGLLAGSLASFSIGAAGLAMGIGAGVVALGKQSDLEDQCPSRACDPADEELRDAAVLNGSLSTVGFVIAGVGAGLGLTLLIVDLQEEAPATVTVSPTGLWFRAQL